MTTSARYTIGELADLTGISRRTVRFYVQRNLLPPPLGAGRGHYYTADHLARLHSIKALQDAGLSLDEIAGRLDTPLSPNGPTRESFKTMAPEEDFVPADRFHTAPAKPLETAITTELWIRLLIAPGCDLHLDRSRFRPTQAQFRRIQQAITEILDPSGPVHDSPTREENTDE